MFLESLGCIPGGGHSIIWPKQVCTPEQGMVCRALTLYGYTVSLFSVFGVCFWTGCL